MKYGAIAQLVEQRTENPCVPGSIPGGTTLRLKLNSYLRIQFFCFYTILYCLNLAHPINLWDSQDLPGRQYTSALPM